MYKHYLYFPNIIGIFLFLFREIPFLVCIKVCIFAAEINKDTKMSMYIKK